MKKLALAAALSFAATTAFAGGLDQPVMEKEVAPIVEKTTMEKTMKKKSGIGSVVVPLMFLVLVGAVVTR